MQKGTDNYRGDDLPPDFAFTLIPILGSKQFSERRRETNLHHINNTPIDGHHHPIVVTT